MIYLKYMRNIINHAAFRTLKKVMAHWGLGDIEATIYALLAIKNTPMSAKEISQEIDYAYSSVVNALNHLRRHELVERDKKGKCYAYRAVIDFVKIITNERRRVIKFLTEARESLENKKDKYRELIKHIEDGLRYLGKIDEEVGSNE